MIDIRLRKYGVIMAFVLCIAIIGANLMANEYLGNKGIKTEAAASKDVKAEAAMAFCPIEENLEEMEEDTFLEVESPVSEEIQKLVYKECGKRKISFPLVVALIETESGGNAGAVSETDDFGLMQINKCNHNWMEEKLGIKDFLNPKDNIKAGCYLLARLLKAYDGEPAKALMAYNMGGSMAEKLWKQGVHSTEYTDKIMNREAAISDCWKTHL